MVVWDPRAVAVILLHHIEAVHTFRRIVFLPEQCASKQCAHCRSKHAESSFLELYQQLYEAPDPTGVLHGALGAESQLAQLGAQNAKLERELQEFQTEAKGIKNQELTIRKLEERCKSLEADLATKVWSASVQHVISAVLAMYCPFQDYFVTTVPSITTYAV